MFQLTSSFPFFAFYANVPASPPASLAGLSLAQPAEVPAKTAEDAFGRDAVTLSICARHATLGTMDAKVVGNNGGNVISPGEARLAEKSADGGSLVATGGGNLLSTGSGLVAQGAGNFSSPGS